MDIVFLLFDRFTALDAIGPYEVLSRLPGAKVRFVAAEAGIVRTDNGFLGVQADGRRDDVERCDILVVPGGKGSRALESDPATLAWIRKVHATTQWTVSVCTGSMIFAAAGLLEGKEATTHWSRLQELAEHGATPVTERYVFAGDRLAIAAGVSAGIDLGLALIGRIGGEDLARAIQLGVEYDPQPPFDGGSVAKTSEPVLAIVGEALDPG